MNSSLQSDLSFYLESAKRVLEDLDVALQRERAEKDDLFQRKKDVSRRIVSLRRQLVLLWALFAFSLCLSAAAFAGYFVLDIAGSLSIFIVAPVVCFVLLCLPLFTAHQIRSLELYEKVLASPPPKRADLMWQEARHGLAPFIQEDYLSVSGSVGFGPKIHKIHSPAAFWP